MMQQRIPSILAEKLSFAKRIIFQIFAFYMDYSVIDPERVVQKA
ncbi:MAG: hypothetical protein QXG05_06485 [Nitrososphaerota archaeon]